MNQIQEVTPSMRGVRALAILLPLLVPAAFPAAALAHASLLRSDPSAGSVVPQAPTQMVPHFDERVQDAGTAVCPAAAHRCWRATPGSSPATRARSSSPCDADSATATTPSAGGSSR